MDDSYPKLEATMDYAISSIGMLVHDRKDWPCAVCRPLDRTEVPGAFLCVDCAHAMVASAVSATGLTGAADPWSALSDVADALAQLEDPAFDVAPASTN